MGEATVRLAMRFARADGSGIAGAASAALAEEVLRAMVITKLKVAAGIALMTASWSRAPPPGRCRERDASAPTVAAIAAVPPDEPDTPCRKCSFPNPKCNAQGSRNRPRRTWPACGQGMGRQLCQETSGSLGHR